MDDSAVTCDEVIEPYDKEIKTISTNFNKTKNLQNTKFLYCTCFFIDHHYIIDSCYYILLYNKILSKTKALITISSKKIKTILCWCQRYKH